MRGLGFSSIWIYSALYLRTSIGLTLLQDGLVITVGSAMAALFQIYGGILSDKFGYKRTIIVSFIATFILYVILILDSTARNSQIAYPLVFVALMISNTVQMPATNAIVSQSSDVKLKGFSVLRIGNNIGWGIGPAIGGFLISLYGFYFLFLFAMVTSIAGLLLTFPVEDRKEVRNAVIKFNAANRFLIIMSFVALLLFIVQAQETITLSNYAKVLRGMDYDQLGILYLVNGLVVILTQGIVYKGSRKIGNYSSVIIGGFLYSFGFFSFSFFSSFNGMLLSTVILTFGEDFAFPAGLAMVSLISRPENLGRNMGTYNAFISAGRAIGPLLGGLVLSFSVNPYVIWGFTTIPGFLSIVIFSVAFRGNRGAYEETPVQS